MAISRTDDFKAVEDLCESPEAIFEHVQKTGRPVVVTESGKPAAVLLTADQYEKMVHTLNLGQLLAKAEEDIRAGPTCPVEVFFKELLGKTNRAKKVSGGNGRRGRARHSVDL